MTKTFVTYRVARAGGTSAGLSILLDDPFGHAPHVRIAALHQAALAWGGEHPGADLQTEVGAIPRGAAGDVKRLHAYLLSGGEVNGARLCRHLDLLLAQGTIPRLTPRPGNPVGGVDLVGRENILEQLVATLRSGSCHLRAPRKYGKTSLLRELVRRLEKTGRHAMMVDLSAGESPRQFVLSVVVRGMDHASVRQAIAGLPELAGWPVSGADPVARSAARDALSQRLPPVLWPFCRAVLQAMAEAGVVLLLDEFSVFLRTSLHEDKLGTESLLKVLKELRHRNPPLRMAVAGSTGLSAFVLFHGLSDELSDLPGTELPALSLADGRTLAEELLYGMDLLPSERVIDAILECIGEPVPYFVHALADAVREETPPGDQPTPERVRMAYGERVVGPLGSYLFRGYRLSTHPYPPEVLAPAARLLRRLARSDQPLPAAELRREYELSAAAHLAGRFDALLACLQEDYDLEQGEGTWRMRSKVLRDRFRLAAPFGGEE